MDQVAFRKELIKIMPGYSWTVHQNKFKSLDSPENYALSATGIQSSGSNRLSTLQVIKRVKQSVVEYHVKSSGYGCRAPWLHECFDTTLARALRMLQDHYTSMASTYSGHARALETGRTAATK